MLRLYLERKGGTGLIPCPRCGRPLLLGAEKMGRWLVGYESFRIGPKRRRAMLVCPTYDCDYVEPVELTAQRGDAVIFNPEPAAESHWAQQQFWSRTLEELSVEYSRIKALYRETKNPKLPSAMRFVRDTFLDRHGLILYELHESLATGREVTLEGRNESMVSGRVREIRQHSLLLERSDTGEQEVIRLWDLRYVWTFYSGWKDPELRFDFGKERKRPEGVGQASSPGRFAVIGGHALALQRVDQYGLVTVSTDDPAAGRDLRLVEQDGSFVGEFPAALVERCFKVISYVHVQGFRLHVKERTDHPDWVEVRTREMEAARALRLREVFWIVNGERQQLAWWGYLHRDEWERWEDVQIPIRLPRVRRRR